MENCVRYGGHPLFRVVVVGVCFTMPLMLSYQWEIQQDVIRVRHRLNAEGIDTWMDIDNGMDVDLYDSMAEGVENASCVICFVDQAYQDSENCQCE